MPKFVTPHAIREAVATLPVWDPKIDEDPNWLYSITYYGMEQLARGEIHKELVRRIGWGLENNQHHDVTLDPKQIKYVNQPHIRLDALKHYLDSSELFDKDGWYGTEIPVVTHWKKGYAVFDGTHRVIANQLMGRQTKVRVVSQYLH
jgi:hypothetical protein